MRSTTVTLWLGLALLMLATAPAQASSSTFLTRVKRLQTRYPGQINIATMNRRPAIFVSTKFGQGDYYNWTPAQQAKFEAFRKDLLKALGTNTVQAFNPVGDDYLHVGTGTGTSTKLAAANKGRVINLYGNLHDEPYDLPDPSTERTCVLVNLTNKQLTNTQGKGFDQYLTAIRNDYNTNGNMDQTLGAVEYNGGTPPFVSGRSDGTHNCTSWFTSWLQKFVGGGFYYGADPPSWCRSTSTCSARALRGMLIFNHANPPQDGQSIPNSFPLNFE